MVGKLKELFKKGEGKGCLFSRYYGVALVLLAGICLMLWPTSGETQEVAVAAADPGFDLQQQEEKLQQLLSQMEGVGKVQVMLSLQESSRQILAEDRKIQYNGSVLQPEDLEKEEMTLTVSRGSGEEEVVVTQTVYPQYRGALVVCTGGNNAEVKLAVTEAVSVITGLRSDRISVCAWGED